MILHYFAIACFIFCTISAAPQGASPDKDAQILEQANSINDNGYEWSYKTSNNIQADEKGTLEATGNAEHPNVIVAQGSYSYIDPEGIEVKVTYVANKDGFQAQGVHIPTPPPIPPEIQKALEIIKAKGASN